MALMGDADCEETDAAVGRGDPWVMGLAGARRPFAERIGTWPSLVDQVLTSEMLEVVGEVHPTSVVAAAGIRMKAELHQQPSTGWLAAGASYWAACPPVNL